MQKMGRTEPTVVKPPPAFRRDARAKRARATINRVIPALLTTHPRARRGIERSELVLDPPRLDKSESKHEEGKVGAEGGGSDGTKNGGGVPRAKGSGRRRKSTLGDEQPREKTAAQRRDDGNNTSDRRIEKEKENGEVKGPRIRLCVADTLAAAHSLLVPGSSSSSSPTQQSKHQSTAENGRQRKVGILNMASPLSPGGGFLNGATSQEESLCMRTTLLPALRDEFYRLPELGIVYTPDVLVFRPTSTLSSSPSSSSSSSSNPDRKIESSESIGNEIPDEKDILPKNDRWFIDVVTAAMLRLPETEDGRYATPADRELVLRKMRAVMRVFAAKGCTHVVLGAWGCGAYGNPVSEVAEAWRRVLVVGPSNTVQGNGKGGQEGKSAKSRNKNRTPENWGPFIEEVVFAIKDGGMAAAFAQAFGEDVLSDPSLDSDSVPGGEDGSLSGGFEDQEEDPVQAAQVAELREKIAQLEIQVAQVRSLQLKNGLETVLAGLRKQLPTADEDEGGDVDGDGEELALGEEESASEVEDEDDNLD
ncbi:hypothetical protein F5Y03DRAFT_248984 [Xylaria venustula]|nr:hypothetical protein F5Y03DRAFT_248984 [Xylaria venustula]